MSFKSWQNQVLAFKGTPFKGIMECYFHLYFFFLYVFVGCEYTSYSTLNKQTNEQKTTNLFDYLNWVFENVF